jgi:DNA-binding CsgD family transcriptional regulator
VAETAAAAARAAGRVAASTQPLLVVDDECVCVEVSLGACRLLGAARGDVVGRPLAGLLEADSRERFSGLWDSLSTAGGHAEPFTLEAPAAALEVGVTVTAGVLPARHLIALEPTADASGRDRPSASGVGAPPAATTARPPTARELQILGLLAAGATDGQIAAMLDLSPATVQTHVRNAKAKLGARTRAQAVALALRQGLIDAP